MIRRLRDSIVTDPSQSIEGAQLHTLLNCELANLTLSGDRPCFPTRASQRLSASCWALSLSHLLQAATLRECTIGIGRLTNARCRQVAVHESSLASRARPTGDMAWAAIGRLQMRSCHRTHQSRQLRHPHRAARSERSQFPATKITCPASGLPRMWD